MVVMESEEHFRNRGGEMGRMLGEIVGYGWTSDGDHLVRPEAIGRQQVRAMGNAIRNAGVGLVQIDCVNTHATSTLAGD